MRSSIYAGAGALVSVLLYLLLLNHVGVNHVGIAYSSIGGKVWVQRRPGWYVTSPAVFVTTVSTLPRRLQIPTAARVLNWKLVRFDPDGAETFVHTQGFEYWEDNEMNSILVGYAFSKGRERYPFLKVLEETEGVE